MKPPAGLLLTDGGCPAFGGLGHLRRGAALHVSPSCGSDILIAATKSYITSSADSGRERPKRKANSVREFTKVRNRLAVASALAAGTLAVALFNPAPVRAAIAQQGPAGQSVGAAFHSASMKALDGPCRILKIYALVRLWWCDGTQGTRRGYHGDGYLGGGGAVWLVSAAGTPTAFTTSNVSGWFNTPTVGDHGAPWRACKHNRPIDSPHECTAYGSR